MPLLPDQTDFDGPFPRLSRRLRLGVVGGGRISGMQAAAARLTGRWDVVAAAFSSDAVRAKAASAERFLPQERCYTSFEDMAKANMHMQMVVYMKGSSSVGRYTERAR